MKTTIILSVALLALVGCNKQKSTYKGNADAFLAEMNSSTGEDYSIAKLDTEMYGFVVFKNNTTSEYTAYNILKWDSGQSFNNYLSGLADTDYVTDLEMHAPGVQTVWQEYIIDYDDYTYSYPNIYNSYYDTYYTDRPPTSYGSWRDITHSTSYFTGGGFTFDESRSLAKDLESKLGKDESENIKIVSSALEAQYGLSEDKSLSLAKLYSQYSEMTNLRSLSDAEKKEFEVEAFGVSLNEFEKAFIQKKKGEENNLNTLIQKASEHNELAPEVIRNLIDQMF